MAQNVTLCNLLLSCPSDIKDEISLVKTVVEEFNELYADTFDVIIRVRHWSKSSYAKSGGKPQALLNEQFVDKCDAAIAIFWTRFGSPTDEYSSGTEEEIERMLQSGKQVFMYFSDKPIAPSQLNDDGYKKIQAFREKYKDRGVYFTYSSDSEFKELFSDHLAKHFLSEQKRRELASQYAPQLKLLGIDEEGKLSAEASIYPFTINAKTTKQQYLDIIRNMYQEIAKLNVGKRTPVSNTFFTGFKSPVEIDENEREYLSITAEELQIELPDDFFDLGNLNKDSLALESLSGPKLHGSSDEKQKYRKIKKLHETILLALEWAPIETAFSDKRCIRLAIQNCGKAIDEDVEISFEIPQKSLLTLDEFPQFENSEKGYLLNDCDMSELFGIDSTADFDRYSESVRNRIGNCTPVPCGLPGYIPDYSDAFIAKLSNVFCYSIYADGDNYIVKLKVDYIKHNTAVSFPTILFVKDTIQKIPYKISSKNNPEIVEGILTVKDDV